MEKIFCDKCKKEILYSTKFKMPILVQQLPIKERWKDLCKQCNKELFDIITNWLKDNK